MDDFLNLIILENTVKQWIITLLIIAVAFIVRRILSEQIARVIAKLFHKAEYQTYNNYFIKKVVQPLETLLFWGITFFALDKLSYPSLLEMNVMRNYSLKQLLEALSSAWLIICFFRLLIGINYFIGYIIKNNSSKIDNRSASQAISLVSDIISVLLVVIAVFIILKASFNYDISSLLTSLGLVTAALALAAKETVENTICSFVILFDKPFMVGDFIKVNNISGNVEKIGIRSTRIRTADKTLISIPNKVVIGGSLENTSDQTRRRYQHTMELSLSTSQEKIESFIETVKAILQKKNSIIQEDTMVCFLQTGVNAHKIFVEYYTWMNVSFKEFRALNENVNLEIISSMQELDIEFSDPGTSKIIVEKNNETPEPIINDELI